MVNEQDQQHLEWLGGSSIRVVLDSAATAGQLTVISVLQDGDASPLHQHQREDEAFFLTSGSAVVWSGDDRWEVAAGGVAFLTRGVPHAYRITPDDTRMPTLCTLGGAESFSS
ncbi:MAG: cupin domain-containing protein [Marmoricola sp.]